MIGSPRVEKIARKRDRESHSPDRVSSCTGKVAFDSYPIAEKAAGRRARRYVYRCGYCQHFHIGREAGR